MGTLLFEKETEKIIGACFEVYRHAGQGFLEPVYQESLELEFHLGSIPAQAQVHLPLSYKGIPLRQKYIPDFVCYGSVIVELKAVQNILKEHEAQMINYLHATGMRVGLLVNFGHYPGLQFKRFVL